MYNCVSGCSSGICGNTFCVLKNNVYNFHQLMFITVSLTLSFVVPCGSLLVIDIRVVSCVYVGRPCMYL